MRVGKSHAFTATAPAPPGVRWFGHWSTRTRAQARDALKSFRRNYPGRKFRIVPEVSGGLSGLFWVIQIGVAPGD